MHDVYTENADQAGNCRTESVESQGNTASYRYGIPPAKDVGERRSHTSAPNRMNNSRRIPRNDSFRMFVPETPRRLRITNRPHLTNFPGGADGGVAGILRRRRKWLRSGFVQSGAWHCLCPIDHGDSWPDLCLCRPCNQFVLCYFLRQPGRHSTSSGRDDLRQSRRLDTIGRRCKQGRCLRNRDGPRPVWPARHAILGGSRVARTHAAAREFNFTG